jgi:transposase
MVPRTAEGRIDGLLAPIRRCARLLTTIPGVSDLTAQVVPAEIGADMARFPTPAHLLSWAMMCPRNEEAPASAARPAPAKARHG